MRRRSLLARALVVAVFLTIHASPATAGTEDPLGLTLQRIKQAYREKRLDEAEGALRTLGELLTAPERESVRPRVLPAYHFYAAAVAWERKDETRAKDELLRFFTFQPDATVDPSAYPKSFRIFFEAQREQALKAGTAGSNAPGPQSIAGGVLPDYAARDLDASTIPAYSGDPDWVTTPVQFLLSDQEKSAFKRLQDEDARREFVGRFWQSLDPTPLTPENEFEAEFYRRAQYCDATFSTEATRGSLTDRAMVFLVLGPPTYVGRAPLLRSQDMMNYLRTTEIAQFNDGKGGHALVRVPSDRASVTPGDIEGEVETWYYRRDRIPKGVAFNDLQYLFVTRTGYGTCVLQKESRELIALQKAASLLKSPGR